MFDTEDSEKLYFAIKANVIQSGLEEQIETFVKENSDTNLVIIDTLQKIREVSTDKYCYASDYEIISRIKEIADEKHICILLVHHTRKQGATDTFETISGSQGLLGAADGAFIITKEKRNENKAVLQILGRDQPDMKMILEGDFMSKSVQISVELFTELVKYPLLNVDNNVELIQKELHKKLERLNNREIYTNSKTAASQEERENSRKEYLERKGIPESFRW